MPAEGALGTPTGVPVPAEPPPEGTRRGEQNSSEAGARTGCSRD